MAIDKEYITATDYLHDIWRLACGIAKAGFKPDVLIALWRGGAPVGVAVHEFLSYLGYEIRHIPLKCSSYTGIGENGSMVQFEHPEVVFNSLNKTDKALIVDDVFDTGETAKAVLEKMEGLCKDVKIACTYWKKPQNRTGIVPDFFVKEVGCTWLVFPHEMLCLSNDEIKQKDEVLFNMILECKRNVR